MDTYNTILQWNCRGFRANFEELKLIAKEINPSAFCLQETKIKDNTNISFKGYANFHTYGPLAGPLADHATGGASILVRQDIYHSQVPINTNIQAVAIRVTLHKTITLCSIYLPPKTPINLQDLNNLLNQLPPPFLLMGDFNSHNPLWGGNILDGRGRVIEDFVLSHSLCLLNNGSNTYLHPGHGTYSAIDLTVVSPELFMDFSWRVLDDLHGSDHFPIKTKFETPSRAHREPAWRINKADWHLFNEQCQQQLNKNEELSANKFAEILSKIADETIPKTSTYPKHISNPWFDDSCAAAVRDRKKSLRRFFRQPSHANLINFKIKRAIARRTIKEARRNCWRQYVSSISSRTPLNQVWDKIRRIKGSGSPSCTQHLRHNNQLITDTLAIAETIANTFEENSSSIKSPPAFLPIKRQEESIHLNFRSNNAEGYNRPFIMEELKYSLSKANNSAVGPDKIHYEFLKHLPQECLEHLLKIFNHIWYTGNIPSSWLKATVIPIPKPGKDHSIPNNYRPIALTSCLCKTMERMVNERLVWQL